MSEDGIEGEDALYECDTCGATGDAPCMTQGGYVAMQPHAPRFKLGYTLEMQAKHLDKPASVSKYVKGGEKPTTKVEELKLALWYVTTMGSMERAEKALAAVKAALGGLDK